MVRLRSVDGNGRLEYKAPIDPAWTEWEEIGFDVPDLVAARAVLVKVGLLPGMLIDRIRRECVVGHAELSLDSVRFLGQFLEVNIESDHSDWQREADKILSTLQLSRIDEAEPYGTQASRYNRRRDKQAARRPAAQGALQ